MRALVWLERLNPVASAFVDAALRGALVLLAALVITQLMRRCTAAARHLVWVGAIAIQLVLPVFVAWGPRWRVAVPDQVASVLPVDLQENPRAATDVVNVDARPLAPIVSPPSAAARHGDAPAVSDAPRISGKSLLVALWIAGATFILARLAVGTTIVASLAREGNRVDDGNWLSLAQKLSANLQIDRPLTLLRGNRVGVPITWGIVYPVVLLPDDADTWPEDRRRFVLVHEMAHVKRLDALTQLAGQLTLALFWFNPLVWIANRRMQLEREHACDDYVIRHGTSPSQYAEELLSMVRSLGAPEKRSAQPAFAALAMARRSEFEGRMLSILDPVLDRHPLSKGRTLTSACAALLLVAPLVALQPYQRSTVHSVPRTMRVRDAHRAGRAWKPAPPLDTALRVIREGVKKLAGGATALSSGATPTMHTPGCDNARFGGTGESLSSHSHDDGNGNGIVDITKTTGARCSSALIVGQVRFSANDADITQMPFGTHAVFRERTTTDDRELTVTPSANGILGGTGAEAGQPTRMYRRNGRSAPFDEDARRWFGDFLPTVLMDAGVNVSARVARWRAQGGVDKTLEQIARMSSSATKRAHYEALLSGESLTADDLDRVIRSASQTLGGNSGDLRSILTMAAPKARLSGQGVSALERVLVTMASSGDKAAVLQLYGDTGDRAMLLMVMRASESVGSAGDRARLHQVLTARYLANEDRVLHSSWFDHAVQIGSSGDLRNTLMVSVPYAAGSVDIANRIIEASRSIASSGDRSAVLISLVSSHAVTTKDLRDQFFNAASEISSEGDRSRVLQSAALVLK